MSQQTGPIEAAEPTQSTTPETAETASGSAVSDSHEVVNSISTDKEAGNGDKASKKESQDIKNQERVTVSSPSPSSPSQEHSSSKSNGKDS